MSNANTITPMSMPLIVRRTRAFYAPVNRVTKTATIFDPAQESAWKNEAPSAPWIDLGWIEEFGRMSTSVLSEVVSGLPSMLRGQARQRTEASLSWRFCTWSKLAMALSTGSEHMNVLAPGSTTLTIGSGAKAMPAVSLLAPSVASTLYTATPAPFGVGDIVAVDVDYGSQIGFVGTGASAAYVQSPSAVGNDPDYVRRVSFNVGKVVAVKSDGGLQLAAPLMAGVPTPSMKVQKVLSFVDREGGSFLHEWSALFVLEGAQGDRLFLHYPRLQACQGARESWTVLAADLSVVQPNAYFKALPVTDANDGQEILCYRTYVPCEVGSI